MFDSWECPHLWILGKLVYFRQSTQDSGLRPVDFLGQFLSNSALKIFKTLCYVLCFTVFIKYHSTFNSPFILLHSFMQKMYTWSYYTSFTDISTVLFLISTRPIWNVCVCACSTVCRSGAIEVKLSENGTVPQLDRTAQCSSTAIRMKFWVTSPDW